MGRYNRSGRSPSYSPRRSLTPPPPPPRRRHDDPRDRRYDDPRDRRYDDPRDRRSSIDRRRSPAPSGLLVRNISLDSRPEDLRIPFERFGPVKDVYLPKNYYTGEPRGFGFVKFRNAEDAAEAKHQLNHCIIGGREIAIVFAEENRKTPREMRTTGQPSGRYGGGSRRRSPPRFSRRRSYSRSISPARHDFRERKTRDRVSPSRSLSPHKPRRYSRSPVRNGGPPMDGGLDQKDETYEKRGTGERKSGVGSEDGRRRSLSRSPPMAPARS